MYETEFYNYLNENPYDDNKSLMDQIPIPTMMDMPMDMPIDPRTQNDYSTPPLSPYLAGQAGQLISNAGGTPLFTNLPERANDPNAIYTDMKWKSNPNMPQNMPTNSEMDLVDKFTKFIDDHQPMVENRLLSMGLRRVDPVDYATSQSESYLQRKRPAFGTTQDVSMEDQKMAQLIYKQALFQAEKQNAEYTNARKGVEQQYFNVFQKQYGAMQQTKYQQGGVTTKGLSAGYNPKTNEWEVNINGKNVPWNKEAHGEIREGRVNANLPDKSFSEWDATAKEQEARNFILFGTNSGRFSTRDARSTNQFKEFLANYQQEKGISTEAMAAIRNEAASKKTSLNKQQINRDNVEIFTQNIEQQIQEINKIYQEVKRSGFRLFDLTKREVETRAKGSGAEAELASYLMEVSREIGKISTGAQSSIAELSVEAQQKWDKVHDPNLSFSELSKVLNATNKQGKLRLNSMDNVLEKTQNSLDGLIDKYSTKKESKKTVVDRRISRDGRPMVKYSDGTIAYE